MEMQTDLAVALNKVESQLDLPPATKYTMMGFEIPESVIPEDKISFDATKSFTGMVYRSVNEETALGMTKTKFRRCVVAYHFRFNGFRIVHGKIHRGSLHPLTIANYVCPSCKVGTRMSSDIVKASQSKGNFFCHNCFSEDRTKHELVRDTTILPMMNTEVVTAMVEQLGETPQANPELLLPVFGVFNNDEAPGVWTPTGKLETEAAKRAAANGMAIRPFKMVEKLRDARPASLIGLASRRQAGWVDTQLLSVSGRESRNKLGYMRVFPKKYLTRRPQEKRAEAVTL